MFKMKKVFDCQEMPADIRDAFFCTVVQGNDCLITWYVDSDVEDGYEDSASIKLINNWLYANGAEPSDVSVIISHWW